MINGDNIIPMETSTGSSDASKRRVEIWVLEEKYRNILKQHIKKMKLYFLLLFITIIKINIFSQTIDKEYTMCCNDTRLDIKEGCEEGIFCSLCKYEWTIHSGDMDLGKIDENRGRCDISINLKPTQTTIYKRKRTLRRKGKPDILTYSYFKVNVISVTNIEFFAEEDYQYGADDWSNFEVNNKKNCDRCTNSKELIVSTEKDILSDKLVAGYNVSPSTIPTCITFKQFENEKIAINPTEPSDINEHSFSITSSKDIVDNIPNIQQVRAFCKAETEDFNKTAIEADKASPTLIPPPINSYFHLFTALKPTIDLVFVNVNQRRPANPTAIPPVAQHDLTPTNLSADYLTIVNEINKVFKQSIVSFNLYDQFSVDVDYDLNNDNKVNFGAKSPLFDNSTEATVIWNAIKIDSGIRANLPLPNKKNYSKSLFIILTNDNDLLTNTIGVADITEIKPNSNLQNRLFVFTDYLTFINSANVLKKDTAVKYWSRKAFAHEIGHLLGLEHANGPITIPFLPYQAPSLCGASGGRDRYIDPENLMDYCNLCNTKTMLIPTAQNSCKNIAEYKLRYFQWDRIHKIINKFLKTTY